MMHRVYETLAHKLGMLPPGISLTEETMNDYLTMFNRPLPQDAIEALACLFKLDCPLLS